MRAAPSRERLRWLLRVLLIMCLPAPAAALPRVASLNLCTDELVLLLAAPEQIVSVTHLSQQAAESPLWRTARRYPRNDGSLASVAALRPQLVLTMGGGARDRRTLGGRLGIRVLDLTLPATLDDVQANVDAAARALGRARQGAALNARLTALRRTAPRAATDTIWLGGGGRTVAPASLDAQWMALAGLRQRAVSGDRVSLETLLVRPPRLILRSDYRQGQYSAAQRWLAHPLARGLGRVPSWATDGRRWTCRGPLMIPEVLRLRERRG